MRDPLFEHSNIFGKAGFGLGIEICRGFERGACTGKQVPEIAQSEIMHGRRLRE